MQDPRLVKRNRFPRVETAEESLDPVGLSRREACIREENSQGRRQGERDAPGVGGCARSHRLGSRCVTGFNAATSPGSSLRTWPPVPAKLRRCAPLLGGVRPRARPPASPGSTPLPDLARDGPAGRRLLRRLHSLHRNSQIIRPESSTVVGSVCPLHYLTTTSRRALDRPGGPTGQFQSPSPVSSRLERCSRSGPSGIFCRT